MRFFSTAVTLVFLLAASPAQARNYGEEAVAALEAEGYSVLLAERTLLGRYKIVATFGDKRREMVIDPRNGIVLRDLVSMTAAEGRAKPDEKPSGSGSSGSGSTNDGSDHHSNDDTDEKDEDRSGPSGRDDD